MQLPLGTQQPPALLPVVFPGSVGQAASSRHRSRAAPAGTWAWRVTGAVPCRLPPRTGQPQHPVLHCTLLKSAQENRSWALTHSAPEHRAGLPVPSRVGTGDLRHRWPPRTGQALPQGTAQTRVRPGWHPQHSPCRSLSRSLRPLRVSWQLSRAPSGLRPASADLKQPTAGIKPAAMKFSSLVCLKSCCTTSAQQGNQSWLTNAP